MATTKTLEEEWHEWESAHDLLFGARPTLETLFNALATAEAQWVEVERIYEYGTDAEIARLANWIKAAREKVQIEPDSHMVSVLNNGIRMSSGTLRSVRGAKRMRSAATLNRATVAGALLQIAHQTINLALGPADRDAAAPAHVPRIAGEDIRTIIRIGRNRAAHWDEGASGKLNRIPVDAVRVCDALATAFPAEFANWRTRSCAWEFVQLLGWKSVDELEQTVASIIGPKAYPDPSLPYR